MKFSLILVCCFFSLHNYGQYYFNDILSTKAGNEQFKLFRLSKVKKIKATSFEADNSITKDFLLEEDISMDGKKATLHTSTSDGKISVTIRMYEQLTLKRTQSYTNQIENKTNYEYDTNGRVQKITLTTIDTAMQYTSEEAHEWNYDEVGNPVSMLRIKNKVDTLLVSFVKDEKGMIAEEVWSNKSRKLETYYYYYDDAGHLTDIVLYHTRLKKLMPDFQYEYDEKGRISQMVQLLWGSVNYIVWKYTYNEKGLKQSELGFDKARKLIGRIEYTYE